MKKLLISIDTEGDNLWRWKLGDSITTENAKCLPRFQELCESYGFKPTYLTNYEMAQDSFFVDFFKRKSIVGLCEIGMHLHAWNSPPDYDLSVRSDVKPGAPYLIEYPRDIMQKKISAMTRLLEDTFETKVLTHRAGRWATNQDYFEILHDYGYKIDCSVTPSIDWKRAPGQSPGSAGTDYSIFPIQPYRIDGTDMLEIPVTIRENHRLKSLKGCGVRKAISRIKESKRGYGSLWLRPRSNKENLDDLLYLTDLVYKEKNTDYIMFMLHSSELMPGGSPTFPDAESIEALYTELRVLFEHISQKFIGSTFKEYYEGIKNNYQ